MINFHLDVECSEKDITDEISRIEVLLENLPGGDSFTPDELKLSNDLMRYMEYCLDLLERRMWDMDQAAILGSKNLLN